MIRNNIFYKLLALSIAFVLWIYVNSERNPQSHRVFNVGLKVIHTPKGYAAEPAADQISVTLNGPKADVDNISKDDISTVVDLGNVKPDRNVSVMDMSVRVKLADDAPNSISVSANPKSVSLRVEAITERRIPIEAKFQTSPPLGYAYSGPWVSPNNAGIRGKYSEVMRVKRVIATLPNSAPGAPIDEYYPLLAVDSGGREVRNVKLYPEKARVQLKFEEVPARKSVLISPNVFGQPQFPLKVARVSVSPTSVTLEGRPAALADVSTISTDRVNIDAAETTVTRDVALRLPSDVRVVGRSRVRIVVYLAMPE